MTRINEHLILKHVKTTKKRGEKTEAFLERLTHLQLGEKKISVIENLWLCPNAEVLYLYDNSISKMEGLSAVGRLTHLYLQNNEIEVMEGLGDLPLLTKLYLNGNRISRLEGLEKCTFLEELYLSNQRIQEETFTFCVDSLSSVSGSLKLLTLANNNVDDVEVLGLLESLTLLDVSNNNIGALTGFKGLFGGCGRLTTLNVSENPVCSERKYRDKMIVMSRVTTLDGKEVHARTRQSLQRLKEAKRQKRETRDDQENVSGQENEHGTHEGLEVDVEVEVEVETARSSSSWRSSSSSHAGLRGSKVSSTPRYVERSGRQDGLGVKVGKVSGGGFGKVNEVRKPVYHSEYSVRGIDGGKRRVGGGGGGGGGGRTQGKGYRPNRFAVKSRHMVQEARVVNKWSGKGGVKSQGSGEGGFLPVQRESEHPKGRYEDVRVDTGFSRTSKSNVQLG